MSSTKPTTDQILHNGENLHDWLEKTKVTDGYDVIYASDFGVKTDGSDNEQALYDLSMHLSTVVTAPTRVIFPHGTSLVGSQKLAGQFGLGYSYEPSYLVRSFPSVEGRGYFFVSLTQVDIQLDMTGWTLKRNDGSKVGSFDPVTGAVAPDQVGASPNTDYRAYSGNLMIIFKSPNVRIVGGTLNGNISGTSWGGRFGDDGWQIHAYNLWINQSGGVLFDGFKCISSPVDCLYVGETASFNPDPFGVWPLTQFKNCDFTDAGRNVVTIAGGANIEFLEATILRGGANAQGISGHESLPKSCVDVEAEGGRIHNLRFKSCDIMDSSHDSIQIFPAVGAINGVLIDDCRVKCMTGDAAINVMTPAAGVVIRNSRIVGSLICASTGREATVVEYCEINNSYGGAWTKAFRIHGKFERFNSNRVFINLPPTGTNYPMFDVVAGDAIPGGLGVRSQCRDNFIQIWQGSSDTVTHVDLGGFSNFRDLTMYVDAAAMTGAKVLAIYCLNSGVGISGLATNSTKINFGTTVVKVAGHNVWYGTNDIPVSGTIVPILDNGLNVGRNGRDFSNIYLNKGIFMYGPNGQRYQGQMNASGSFITPPVP